jgi:hypothetical protein
VRAFVARITRCPIASPDVRFALSAFSSAVRTMPSMTGVTSALFSRSFVWPWNCGCEILIASSAMMPSRVSSAESCRPRGTRLCVVR